MKLTVEHVRITEYSIFETMSPHVYLPSVNIETNFTYYEKIMEIDNLLMETDAFLYFAQELSCTRLKTHFLHKRNLD